MPIRNGILLNKNMKVDTIFYLKSILELKKQKLHNIHVESISFLYNPKTGHLNISNKEYSKYNDTLHLGFRQQLAIFNEMIQELNNLLPKV
ncbi:MAG: hypothetical protein Q7R95_11280 [bacterium]|nr:hypothetical protein [bacterium]